MNCSGTILCFCSLRNINLTRLKISQEEQVKLTNKKANKHKPVIKISTNQQIPYSKLAGAKALSAPHLAKLSPTICVASVGFIFQQTLRCLCQFVFIQIWASQSIAEMSGFQNHILSIYSFKVSLPFLLTLQIDFRQYPPF